MMVLFGENKLIRINQTNYIVVNVFYFCFMIGILNFNEFSEFWNKRFIGIR